MQLLIVLIIAAGAFLGGGLITNFAHHTNINTSLENTTTMTPTLMPETTSFIQSPTSMPYISPTSTYLMPTFQPMVTVAPTSQPAQDTVNLQKTQALQGIDDKINSIDQTIANLKSEMNYWLKQQDLCQPSVTPGCTPFPTAPGFEPDPMHQVWIPSCIIINPMIEMQEQTDCVVRITSTINNIAYQIKSLKNEKDGLENQRIMLLSQ